MANQQSRINPVLFHSEVQQWIRQATASLEEIAFGPLPFEGLSRQELLQQIEGYRKTKQKLPKWAAQKGLIFPKKTALEQCSSEATALYKSNLVQGLFSLNTESQNHPQSRNNQSDRVIADLTGGFGVDAYYLSQSGAKVHHFELDQSLSTIVKHNMAQLKARVYCAHKDGIKAITGLDLDLIYLDPARRDRLKNKVFRLEDCHPDILLHQEQLMKHCPKILLKTSPMLDLHLGMTQLKGVKEIHVVAVNNELKEILWLLESSTEQITPRVYAVNLNSSSTLLSQNHLEQSKNEFFWRTGADQSFSVPKNYIYEPNAALRKIGQYSVLTASLPVLRIGPNAHLFTSEHLVDFPGRRFEVIDQWPYSKAQLKAFKGRQFNITTRDFPQTVAKIRADWNIKEGGAHYLFFTTDASNTKWIILCQKPELT